MNTHLYCGIFIAIVGLSACSAKVTGGGDPNGQVISFPITAQATALEGKWILNCNPISGNTYATGETDFDYNSYSTSITLFSDSGCTQAIVPTQNQSGTFVIPSPGQVNLFPANSSASYNVYEIDGTNLYTGLQASSDPSSRPSAVDKDLPFVYAGSVSLTPQATPTPEPTGPFTPPTECPNFSGSYQMNMDYYILTQTSCTALNWVTQGQIWSGVPDQTTLYTANNSEIEVPADTQDDPSLKAFEKSYFENSDFVVDDRLVDNSGTELDHTVYSLTEAPCDLINPDPGATYLMARLYVDSELYSCNYWVKR